MENDDTLEDQKPRAKSTQRAKRSFLFVALDADRPLAGGTRYDLDAFDEVRIERGTHHELVRGSVGSSRSASVRLPGRAVSALHAYLRRCAEGWRLDDAGSTNGTYVNGERVSEATLKSGDVIETGRTFLMVRECEASQSAAEHDGRGESKLPTGFHTLLPGLTGSLTALERVAGSTIPVVLSGETGTGKEVLAKLVHQASGRTGPLVAVNCAALPEALTESQLFGHVRGAFSGAMGDAPGFVRAAQGGTLLLDEIQELRLPAQATLLRVLQEREVVPLGSVKPVAVDVRVIAASSVPLQEAVERGAFRADLWARLAGFHSTLPPLRERREDLGHLVATLLTRDSITERDRPRIDPALAHRMFAYSWPLNVRELGQFLRRAWVLADDGLIDDDHFPGGLAREVTAPASPARPRLSPVDEALRERLILELDRAKGNVAAVARTLGKAPVQVRRWLDRLSIDLEAFRR